MSFHAIREDWLALADEEVLDPSLPIVDPHLHMVERCPLPLFTPPERPFMVAESLAETGSGHNIISTVFVEWHQHYRAGGPEHLRPVGETEWVAAQAEAVPPGETRLCAGLVGWADLTLGAGVEEVLHAHIAAGRGRFRGIRTMAHSDPFGIPAFWNTDG